MMLECGGLQFPGAPFAGWYQGTEVASRDFLDPQRYNLLNPIGDAMGLDKSSNTTLWKVRAHNIKFWLFMIYIIYIFKRMKLLLR